MNRSFTHQQYIYRTDKPMSLAMSYKTIEHEYKILAE